MLQVRSEQLAVLRYSAGAHSASATCICNLYKSGCLV